MSDNYEDIINLPHPVSKNHPRMSLLNRAAQFAPFAALTGHEEALEDTASKHEAFELESLEFPEINDTIDSIS